ncbi:unnamed protein product [Choristocarpus tenellus]
MCCSGRTKDGSQQALKQLHGFWTMTYSPTDLPTTTCRCSLKGGRHSFSMSRNGQRFVVFRDRRRHIIPGLIYCGAPRSHGLGVDPTIPCLNDVKPTCAELERFLPTDCEMSNYNAREIVIVRDPRDVVISEYFYLRISDSMEQFIRTRFESITSWIRQRWVWHTTVLRDSSLMLYYEDLQVSEVPYWTLASWFSLNATSAEIHTIVEATSKEALLTMQREGGIKQEHGRNPQVRVSTERNFNDYNLTTETIAWMNYTMSSLLPGILLCKYGLETA